MPNKLLHAALQPRAQRAALVALGLVVLATVSWFLSWGDRVRFRHDVTLLSAEVSEEASYGAAIRVRLRFQAAGPLPENVVAVVQCNGAEVTCNGVAQARFKQPSTGWRAGSIYAQEIALDVPQSCGLGELSVFAGLYSQPHKALLPVLAPWAENDRVLIGKSELVLSGPRQELRGRDARQLARGTLLSPLLPWRFWLSGIAAVWILVWVTRDSRVSGLDARPPAPSRTQGWLAVLAALVFLAGMNIVMEFIKDDAYISFRYARNLVQGAGLVFNHGERVEGITSILWTLWLVPFEALRWDLFHVCQLTGATLSIVCLFLVTRLTRFMQAEERRASALWGTFWLASSSSFVLYAGSGLEQPLAALLPCAGACILYRSRAARMQAKGTRESERGYLYAGLTLGAACLTRPELHLCALLVPLPVWADVVRARRFDRAAWLLIVGVLLVTAPAHLARYLYYGSLLPNTFYVKTSSDLSIMRVGLDTLRDLFAFNHTGLLLLLAPLALLERRRTLEKVACLAIAYSFLLYYARVGVDEMTWHRLYIPALPFACAAAATGVHALFARLVTWRRLAARPWLLGAAAWLGLTAWMLGNVQLSYLTFNGFDGYSGFSVTTQPDLGKFLTRHERAGGLVAFQDMGATPYYAPDLRFLDFVGLVDQRVAHARHAHGLHAFIENDTPAQAAFDAEMREYFFARNPAWTLLTVYADQTLREPLARAFQADPSGAALAPFMGTNRLQFGLWGDARFRERFLPVRCYRRSAAYYVVVFRRRDLWEQTPREVVLDSPPARLRGARAQFAGGLTLLGSELTSETRERQEVLVTSWWHLPGPSAPDLTFAVQLERAGRTFVREHVPGDFMYPAQRWRHGQILEDRTLLQLPARGLRRGSYQAYLQVYSRATRVPFAIEGGKEAGLTRALLGTLEIMPLFPMFQPIVPRTDAAVMRAHSDRIMAGQQPSAFW